MSGLSQLVRGRCRWDGGEVEVVQDPAERPEGERDRSAHEAAPVLDPRWAEAIVDLRRELSQWNHPSSTEPSWHKDGEYEPSEWSV